jgi:NAD(P)-dependent dehydrogenase (short-subunit alcohol dehydrogenase family)
MKQLMWLKRPSAAIAALVLAWATLGRAQQPAASNLVGLPDGPQVFRTAAATLRVTALKGLVYPWALAFMPNGDILVTEQGRNTLRIVRTGVLDPTPITGLPRGITSTRRDTAGVDIFLHPHFAENRLVYVAYCHWPVRARSSARRRTHRWHPLRSSGGRSSRRGVPADRTRRRQHRPNVAYGVSKAATDKMTADMAIELQPYGVTVVSLYPGLVRTEKVMESAAWLDLSNSESPKFIGRAVAALAADADLFRHTGKVLVAAALANEYGFTDVDGTTPHPLTLADV